MSAVEIQGQRSDERWYPLYYFINRPFYAKSILTKLLGTPDSELPPEIAQFEFEDYRLVEVPVSEIDPRRLTSQEQSRLQAEKSSSGALPARALLDREPRRRSKKTVAQAATVSTPKKQLACPKCGSIEVERTRAGTLKRYRCLGCGWKAKKDTSSKAGKASRRPSKGRKGARKG